MNIDEKDISKLRELLEGYKEQHGTIAVESSDTLNCTCGTFCTHTCENYCDGNKDSCWDSCH